MSAAHNPIDALPAKASARRVPKSAALGLVAVVAFAALGYGVQQARLNAAAEAEARLAAAMGADKQGQARLFKDTAVLEEQPLATGLDAEALNAAEPFSTLPIEPAQPFTVAAVGAPDRARAVTCLSQAIYYEAGFEPRSGRRAVAQVVLNRLRHPAFPNTVCGVVYQGSDKAGCQFSFTCDGSLRRPPEPGAWREAEAIAREALRGTIEPSVGMATHYHADYVFPKWATKLPKVEKIGAHLFYRWPGNWGRRIAFADHYRGGEIIPPLSSLAGWLNVDDAQPETAADPRLARADPTDRRADNDVGGRLDTRTSWRLTFSDPSTSSSSYQATIGEQQADGNAP